MNSDVTSYISPKVEKGLPSKIHGRGLFAVKSIKKDEVVAKKAGYVLTRAELQPIQPTGHIELQIDDNAFLAPKDTADFEKNMIFINHSCDPNVGMRGDREFVAMRDIKPGEELAIDYAMIDDADYTMPCTCGSSKCRKQVTGHDWKNIELQERYKGYFSSYLQEKIQNVGMLKIVHKTRIPTPEAKALKEALEKLNVKVYEEVYTGHMHIDLAIPKAKINIEVDGIHHLTDPNQIIADLNRGYYSNKKGYNTMHIPNEMIRKHLNKISEALAEASKIREQQIHVHVD